MRCSQHGGFAYLHHALQHVQPGVVNFGNAPNTLIDLNRSNANNTCTVVTGACMRCQRAQWMSGAWAIVADEYDDTKATASCCTLQR